MGVAFDLCSQAQALHPVEVVADRKPWTGFEARLVDGDGSMALSVPSFAQVQAFATSSRRYVKGRDSGLAAKVQELIEKPGMSEWDFSELLLRVDPWGNTQLGCVLVQGMGPRVCSYIEETIGHEGGGLEMLRALYAPHNTRARSQRDSARATVKYMAEDIEPLKHKADLGAALITWTAARDRLAKQPGFEASEDGFMEALMRMVTKLG